MSDAVSDGANDAVGASSELRARAKLTWYLEVLGARDDGYHLLRSEMLSLELADRLVIDATGDYLRVVGSRDVPRDDSNLVRRALALVGRTAGVTLDKHIPTGGGLGGGSADAGAILRWAGGVSPEVAVRLGGDVPFCQVGGRALVEGIGERVTALPYRERALTLLLADFEVSTALVYAAYDELVASGERPGGRNHLEEPARRVQPRLGTLLDWARGEFGEVHLAGSGSTTFLEGHPFAEATGDVTCRAGTVKWYQTVATPGA
ncbi:MAG: 4-(cytidine 5'-diphospho)-2-C-methyl-D-erythritol kinase [Acidobacteria bacterium]|nr:4-(cytidine 5'-diphospho)-2-C-methyl-D-erythritol kinase [Acidobacteriota bacterium]